MRPSSVLALAASISSASAAYQGFNYGATKEDGYTFRVQSDYESLFSTAKNLVGTSGFTSARLYTTVQGGTTSDFTSAIPAAISQGTSLLLGIWGSGGQATVTNEINALKAAIAKYGSKFSDLVVGISVGSEDLYRISPTGIAAKSGVGADPATLTSYISQVRAAISGTVLSSVPVGHVDTWTAWVNGTNSPVIQACDFIGMDAYPYFQSTQANSIENGASLFDSALSATEAAVGGKPVWITETGFPVSGSVSGSAQPSIANAKTYWDAVGCPRFGKTNIWWFTLEDTDNATPNPSFGITAGNPMSTKPLFDLSCADVKSSSSSSASSTATSVASSASGASKSSVASASSAATATSALVSSGGGLAPSQGNGIGFNTTVATATGSSTSPTGASGSGNGSGSGSGTSGSSKSSGSSGSSATSTSPATVTANSASVLSGSIFAAIGGLVVAMVAL